MKTSKSLTKCELTPGVYLARQDDLTRVLDLDRGQFYGLDVIASRLLSLALAGGPDRAAAEVARTYGVEPALVRGDLEALLVDLQRRNLLERGVPGQSTRRR